MYYFFLVFLHFLLRQGHSIVIDLENPAQSIYKLDEGAKLNYVNSVYSMKKILHLQCPLNCDISFTNVTITLSSNSEFVVSGFNFIVSDSKFIITSNSMFTLSTNSKVTGGNFSILIQSSSNVVLADVNFDNFVDFSLTMVDSTNKIQLNNVIFVNPKTISNSEFFKLTGVSFTSSFANLQVMYGNLRNLVNLVDSTKTQFSSLKLTHCNFTAEIFILTNSAAMSIGGQIINCTAINFVSMSKGSALLIYSGFFNINKFCFVSALDSSELGFLFIKKSQFQYISCNSSFISFKINSEIVFDDVAFNGTSIQSNLFDVENLNSQVFLRSCRFISMESLTNTTSLIFMTSTLILSFSSFENIKGELFYTRVRRLVVDQMNITNNTASIFSTLHYSRDESEMASQEAVIYKLSIAKSTSTYHIIFENKVKSFAISFINCTFEKNKGSVIRLNTINDFPGQTMNFLSNSFISNSALNGAAFFFSALAGIYSFKNCIFQWNTAEQFGGTFYVNTEDKLFINFEQCSFLSNSAGDSGGAIFNILGSINDTGSLFMNNSAKYSSDIDMSGYGFLNFSNTRIVGSRILSKGSFIGRGQSNILLTNVSFENGTSAGFTAGVFLISTVNAKIINCQFKNLYANYISVLYVSNTKKKERTIFVNDTKISNCTAKSSAVIKVFSSSLLLHNLTTNGVSKEFISLFYSSVTLSSLSFNDSIMSVQFSDVVVQSCLVFSNTQVISIQYSNLTLNSSNFTYVTKIQETVNFMYSQQSQIKIFFTQLLSFPNYMIYSIQCSITMENSLIFKSKFGLVLYFSTIALKAVKFSFVYVTAITLQDFNREKSFGNITNCVFEKTVVSDINYIIVLNSDVYITNAVFDITILKNVIELSRSNPDIECLWKLENISFLKSMDFGSTMVILWVDSKAPTISNVQTKSGRIALSTPPLYLFMTNSIDSILLPGIDSKNTLSLDIKDFYNQTLTFKDYDTAEINLYGDFPKNSYLKNRLSSLKNGVFEFPALSVSTLRNQKLTLEISTKSITAFSALLNQLNFSENSFNSSGSYVYRIQVRIGDCQRGQVFSNDLLRCEGCGPGKYSMDPVNDEYCINCPSFATCPGLDSVIVDPGYWKFDDSMKILVCRQPEACPGGFSNESLCVVGYEGPLCSVCSKGYFRGFKNTCTLCGSKELLFSYCVSIGFLIIMVFYHGFMIRMKINTKRIITTVIIKIFIDHLQMSNLLAALEVPWSFDLFEFFRVTNSINDPYFFMFGIDCILEKAPFGDLTTIIKKLLFFGLLSMFIPFLVAVVWFVLGKVKKYTPSNRNRMFVLSLIILFYSFQPTYISKFFEPNICYKLNVDSLMKPDMKITCWTPKHIYILLFSTPFLISWALIIPIFLLVKMMRCNREIDTRKRLEIPYFYMSKGYRMRFRFWDFVVMLQKIVAITIIAFAKDSFFASFFVLGLFITFLIIQILLEPFSSSIAHYLCLHSRIGIISNIIAAISLKQKTQFPDYAPFLLMAIACGINFSFFIAWFLSYVKVRFGILKYFNIFGLNEYRNMIDSIAMKFTESKVDVNDSRPRTSLENMKTRGTTILENTGAKYKRPRNKHFETIIKNNQTSTLTNDTKNKSNLFNLLSKNPFNVISHKIRMKKNLKTQSNMKKFASIFYRNKEKILQNPNSMKKREELVSIINNFQNLNSPQTNEVDKQIDIITSPQLQVMNETFEEPVEKYFTVSQIPRQEQSIFPFGFSSKPSIRTNQILPQQKFNTRYSRVSKSKGETIIKPPSDLMNSGRPLIRSPNTERDHIGQASQRNSRIIEASNPNADSFEFDENHDIELERVSNHKPDTE